MICFGRITPTSFFSQEHSVEKLRHLDKEKRPSRMSTYSVDEQHARLLSALHEEFLAYGLISTQDSSLFRSLSSGGFTQSSAGAFPPLQYLDRQGRKIVVRALAMFDDLIVNTTVSSGSVSAASASPSAAAREGVGVKEKNDVMLLSRRVTFEVPFWLEEEGAPDRPEVRDCICVQCHRRVCCGELDIGDCTGL